MTLLAFGVFGSLPLLLLVLSSSWKYLSTHIKKGGERGRGEGEGLVAGEEVEPKPSPSPKPSPKPSSRALAADGVIGEAGGLLTVVIVNCLLLLLRLREGVRGAVEGDALVEGGEEEGELMAAFGDLGDVCADDGFDFDPLLFKSVGLVIRSTSDEEECALDALEKVESPLAFPRFTVSSRSKAGLRLLSSLFPTFVAIFVVMSSSLINMPSPLFVRSILPAPVGSDTAPPEPAGARPLPPLPLPIAGVLVPVLIFPAQALSCLGAKPKGRAQ